ncbi:MULTISPECIES: aminoglycoside 6-adenylyltransferase [unclassified Parvimonas]|uniref:aminoglycoside 6-adenylyltransferase n=1 Tax=unclassified Parvimonas TaxID=1151464 RepID=UPI002B487DC1|nr:MULTISPECIES: aminoglycoside 6-adenylyltransferase [unclassified Parvimonas]MEB3024514.1 aminoglycoside 6-adenylyltransferase [Parvimonas sp. M13]MEB3088656.1 aminoglycoside 6-adenylyltransferase [Parvimonas sp. M20]
MNNILTYNELKEIAKKIAMKDSRVEKLFIEQLESQSMSSDVGFFNVLFLVKDLSFDDDSFEYIGDFGDILTMFENTENENVIEYKIIYENFTQGLFRIVSKDSMDSLGELEEKYICVLNKDETKKASVYIERKTHKLTEEAFLENTCEFFWNILKFGNKLYIKEFLNVSEEYRKVLSLLDEHLKHYVLSENKYVIDLGKDNKLVFNYVDTEIFEKYLHCYSELELESLWSALFNICGLFRRLSLQIALNLRFDYAKELDRNTVTFLRELKQKAINR